MSKATSDKKNNQTKIDKLKDEIEVYDMIIKDDSEGKSPSTAQAHYMKAGAFFKLQKLTKDNSDYANALNFYNKAIELSKSENPLYLADRSKFYAETGQIDKALVDIRLVNELPLEDSAAVRLYLGDTASYIGKLDDLKNNLKQSEKAGNIHPEIARVLEEHITVTAGLVVKTGVLEEGFINYENRIEQLESIIKQLQSGSSISGQEIAKLKNETTSIKAQIDSNIAKIQEHEVILQDSGAIAKAAIKRNFATISAESPELAAYLKTFYWTTVNLFESYRDLSTNLMSPNLNVQTNAKESLLVKGAEKLAVYGADIASGIPIVGSVMSLLGTIIDEIYNAVKTNRLEQKIDSINKIIAGKFTTEEYISLNIAQLAFSITTYRKEEILNPRIEKEGVLKNSMNWFEKKFADLKKMILPSVELPDKDSQAAQLALKDVILIFAYLCKNHEAIIQDKLPLDQQLISAIKDGDLDQLLIDSASKSQNLSDSSLVISDSDQVTADHSESSSAVLNSLVSESKNSLETTHSSLDDLSLNLNQMLISKDIVSNDASLIGGIESSNHDHG